MKKLLIAAIFIYFIATNIQLQKENQELNNELQKIYDYEKQTARIMR